TLFVKEDAILANSELEGTLAVGGTATFGDERGHGGGQYPIFHGGVGGNADYDVPTIEGEENRVLIQRFASDSKVVQVKGDGATGVNAEAGAKIGDHTTPDGYTFGPMFGGDGTTFFPEDGNNQSPQMDSVVQPWTDLASAQESWGIDGYVLAHFPDDEGTSIISNFTDWQDVAPPAGNDQTITLNGEGPSRLALSDFEGIEKYQLEGYSESSFLVITVDPADVVDGSVTLPSYSFAGKADGVKEGISHILFDFSAIDGEVEVIAANEPVRGAIYAPNAHIIFPPESDGGKEFEGQLIAENFTALSGGKELHTNLFKGRFPCSDDPIVEVGGFDLVKVLDGVDAGDFPGDTVFTVVASWEVDGEAIEEEFALPVDGSVVAGPQDLPVGTVVSFDEIDVPDLDGYTFTGAEFSPESLEITAGETQEVTLSNTYQQDEVAEGTFNLRKVLSGVEAGEFPEGTTFPVTATWADGSAEFDLPADGSVVSAGVSLPEGTEVSFVEGELPQAPEGYVFESSQLSADSITILADGNEDIAWSVTNTYVSDEPGLAEGTFNLRKVLSGVEAGEFPEGTTFPVTATLADGSAEFDLPADVSFASVCRSLPEGTEVSFVEGELPQAPEGYVFESSQLSADSITILA